MSKLDLAQISKLLSQAGYDPTEQLVAYLETKDQRYITRSGGARDAILSIDDQEIRDYIYSIHKSPSKPSK